MPFIPVPDTAQVQIFGRIDGQTTINDLYFHLSPGPITIPDLQSLALTLDNWVGTALSTLLSSAWQYTRVHVRDLTTATSFALDVNDSATAGGAGGAFVPNNVAPCVSIRTDVAGRSARGRNYIPGTPQAVVTGNTMASGFMADIVASYSALLPGGSSDPDPFRWVVVSRFTGGAPRPTGVVFEVTRPLFVDPTVDSQRRRLPGRGV